MADYLYKESFLWTSIELWHNSCPRIPEELGQNGSFACIEIGLQPWLSPFGSEIWFDKESRQLPFWLFNWSSNRVWYRSSTARFCTMSIQHDRSRMNRLCTRITEHRIDRTRHRFNTDLIVHESVMQKRLGTGSIVHESVMQKRFGTGSIVHETVIQERFSTGSIVHEPVLQKRFGTGSIVHESVMQKRFGTRSIDRLKL